MELLLIKETSPEWEYMWDWVYAHPYNKNMQSEELLQWQYKGSLRQGNRILHQFELGTKGLVLASSSGMSNSDIAKVIGLK